ncbi:MAG: hypothetical protein K8L97_17735 [Anaerolineae bacterium]|nr:hypothetical protein [Anaerolineae bacterium]
MLRMSVNSYQLPENTESVFGDCDCENGFARKERIVVVVGVGIGLLQYLLCG